MAKYLDKIQNPDDLKRLSENELALLTYEIRDFLINKISKTGGHLASNLGVVELTLALHIVFESPNDKLIWDVGHQSYVHKILTGRTDQFDSLRQFKGLSGFPKKEESSHDLFDSGHSSNSISIALGLAKARDLKKKEHSVIAVIGDGALTGGIAYEALNNAGHCNTNFIVVLNDNEMSISQNIGGMSKHLYQLRTTPAYTEIKEKLKKLLHAIPAGSTIHSGLEKIRDAVKYTIVEGIIFEELGFTYLGPVDGHNMNELVRALKNAKNVKGPVFVHVHTKKGKGFRNAEKEPDKYHGIGPFDIETGELIKDSSGMTYSKIFGKKLMDIAQSNPKIVAITAAMGNGTGLYNFSQEFPDRFFDVGIAEQHAVSFAAGLALDGMIPVVAIYSTFLQRSYDQIMMDVCLQNLPVVFCIDRSGIVGSDGETHHGVFDISYLNNIPNLMIMAPKDGNELEAMLDYSVQMKAPCAIRYPRGHAVNFNKYKKTEINGKSEILKEGTDLCIIAVGRMVRPAYEAALKLEKQGIHISVVNARFIKPLDKDTFLDIMKTTKKIITIEDNVINGGFGSSLEVCIQDSDLTDITINSLGWPDQYIQHGTVAELDKKYKLDVDGIIKHVLKML